jgi:hypothetical protein
MLCIIYISGSPPTLQPECFQPPQWPPQSPRRERHTSPEPRAPPRPEPRKKPPFQPLSCRYRGGRRAASPCPARLDREAREVGHRGQPHHSGDPEEEDFGENEAQGTAGGEQSPLLWRPKQAEGKQERGRTLSQKEVVNDQKIKRTDCQQTKKLSPPKKTVVIFLFLPLLQGQLLLRQSCTEWKDTLVGPIFCVSECCQNIAWPVAVSQTYFCTTRLAVVTRGHM